MKHVLLVGVLALGLGLSLGARAQPNFQECSRQRDGCRRAARQTEEACDQRCHSDRACKATCDAAKKTEEQSCEDRMRDCQRTVATAAKTKTCVTKFGKCELPDQVSRGSPCSCGSLDGVVQ